MPIYTIQVTVKIDAESEREADEFLKVALDHSRMAEIIFVESEVIEVEEDDMCAPDPAFPKKLTRQERLEGLADMGRDTWDWEDR